MSKYYKADEETSQKISDLLKEWEATLSRAKKLAKSVGANSRRVLVNYGLLSNSIAGFVFPDGSEVDTKTFCRVKGSDAWRPRRNRKPLAVEFYGLRSSFIGNIMDLIGMQFLGPGLTTWTPGVQMANGVAYLELPDHVKPKNCTRISDTDYEKALKSTKKGG